MTCKHEQSEGVGSVQVFTANGRQVWRAVHWCRRCGAIAVVAETRVPRGKDWMLPEQSGGTGCVVCGTTNGRHVMDGSGNCIPDGVAKMRGVP